MPSSLLLPLSPSISLEGTGLFKQGPEFCKITIRGIYTFPALPHETRYTRERWMGKGVGGDSRAPE